MSETIVDNAGTEETVPTSEATEAPAQTEASTTQEASPAVTNETWYSDDYSTLVESKGFKSADDALKSYMNLEKLQGNSVRIPSEDASPEAKEDFLNKLKDIDGVLVKSDDKFLEKLGRPEKSEDYSFEESLKEEILKDMPSIHDELDDFKSIAHEAGLTNEQANALVKMRMDAVEKGIEAKTVEYEEGSKKLKEMWGTDYENRAEAAKMMISKLEKKYGDDVNSLCGQSGYNPVLMHMFAELAQSYQEKGHEGMSKATFGMTPEQATDKIAEKRADRGFLEAYQDETHPGHRKAVDDLQKLYAIANGQQS